MFAHIDTRTNRLTVVDNSSEGQRWETVADLGSVTTRRAATNALSAAGWTVRGAWRTNTDGDDVRTVA